MNPRRSLRARSRRWAGVLAIAAVVSLGPVGPSSASHELNVCRINAIAIRARCRAELVSVKEDAGAWTTWRMGPMVGYIGTLEWRLSWGDDHARNWVMLQCPAPRTSCVYLASPVRARLEVGDLMLFEGSGTAAWGEAGVSIDGVEFRTPRSPSRISSPDFEHKVIMHRSGDLRDPPRRLL